MNDVQSSVEYVGWTVMLGMYVVVRASTGIINISDRNFKL